MAESRKWRCGHPRTPENTGSSGGWPTCRECRLRAAREHARRKRGFYTRDRTVKKVIDITVPDADAFWAKVERRGADECWPWNGSMNGSGYGHFSAAAETFVASRVAWFLANDTQPGELQVCHTCDNPPCCNPAHLWLGTIADNMADKVAKGRQNSRRKVIA